MQRIYVLSANNHDAEVKALNSTKLSDQLEFVSKMDDVFAISPEHRDILSMYISNDLQKIYVLANEIKNNDELVRFMMWAYDHYVYEKFIVKNDNYIMIKGKNNERFLLEEETEIPLSVSYFIDMSKVVVDKSKFKEIIVGVDRETALLEVIKAAKNSLNYIN